MTQQNRNFIIQIPKRIKDALVLITQFTYSNLGVKSNAPPMLTWHVLTKTGSYELMGIAAIND